MNKTLEKIHYHSLLLISLVSAVGALVYKIYSLNSLGIIITLFLVFVLYYIILRKFPLDNLPESQTAAKTTLPDYILLLFYFITLLFSFYILIKSQTTVALISPWQAIPWYFFLFIAFLLVLLVLQITRSLNLTLLSIILFYFLVFSIAIIVFPLGFGFDPFVHQATLELIAENGAVTPKPLYYLGEYALLTVLDKIPFTPLSLLHFYLVPLLAALFLPYSLYLSLKKYFASERRILFSILFLLILPFSFLTITTPQNLAYLFLILVILLGLRCQSYRELILMYALSLAAIATQAIAGIPALLFTLLLTASHAKLRRKHQTIIFALLALGFIVLLPLAFAFINGQSAAGIPEAVEIRPDFLSFFKFTNPNEESMLLNSLYLIINNLPYLLLVLLLFGVIIAVKNFKHCLYYSLYALAGLGLFLSYRLISYFDFSYLINYERGNFPARILLIALFFFLPFALLALYGLINQILKQNRIIKTSWLAIIALFILASIYMSYPRFDNYHNSHSYTVSQSDINAVNWIENNKENEDYIVLANQQVSAAALHEFGFKKYYISEIGDRRSEIFFYPIPTGGRLYAYYLDMVYKEPSRETMLKAMELTGVNEAYFVLNKYWWAFDKILAEAKLEANSYEIIDKGEVYVFRYLK